jgi:ABC-2 type transport system ATP-binding protein
MASRWHPGRRGQVLLAAAAVVVIIAAVITIAVTASRPAPIGIRNLRIPVVDGPGNNQHVLLDATFFTPAGTGRVPALLLAHGFGQTKEAVEPEAEQFARAGFAVLTWSARGMGDSTGQIALDSPDYEVKDVEQLVTWLSRQPRVLLDHPGDPRVGIAGASYGGAIALLAAAYDHRIDAIVPQITWNNLATALFPNAAGGAPLDGVFKKQWAGLLFTQGSAGFAESQATSGAAQSSSQAPAAGGPEAGGTSSTGTGSGAGSAAAAAGLGGTGSAAARAAQAVQCGRFLPQICAIYQQVAATGQATPAAIKLLLASSPASVAGRIDVPTLLIQGENDSLFGLDQANANYQAIKRNGAPVNMVWFAGGHDGGDQETARVNQLTLQWFDRWLMPPNTPWHPGSRQKAASATGQPAFAVSRDEGVDPNSGDELLGIATAPGYPGLRGTQHQVVRLTGPPQVIANPAGGTPPSMSVFPGLGSLSSENGSGSSGGDGIAFDMPGQTAVFESAPLPVPLRVTGTMTVRVHVGGASQVTLFAKIYDVDQAGNATLPYSLAAPLRVGNAARGTTVTATLPAMDYQFQAGDRLRLVLTTTDFAYATSPVPAVDQVALAGPGLSVPTDPALVVSGRGVPWWTPAAPVAALVAATLILVAGRRRRRETFHPDLADVPLEIAGLTKRYRDGQLAVDDLSLRADRGQILGLLGPNGAGKTTTLRALMGLLHPDAGTITIFGKQVGAGSAALSRLGAFVEGPGFLPHLSGRDNLDMYWRAAGRSAADSRADEVMAIAGLGSAIDRPVRTYSRGMCQRLAIAQAMLGLPDLLVLDEPMNGLDPPQIREMRDVLLGYVTGGRSVVLSSHMLAEVEQTCSHVVVMHQGRRLAAGPVSEIIGDGAALIVGTPEASRAVSVLTELDGIESAQQHRDGVLVHPDGLPASQVVAALVGAGVPVERVMPNRRLEDAFLALIASPNGGGTNGGAANGGGPVQAATPAGTEAGT